MIPELLLLLLFGLCVGKEDIRRDELLPRPSITAWPSWVVPAHTNVTLRCSTPARMASFVLKKGGNIVKSLPSPNSLEGLAEFHLSDLRYSDAGEYTCEYYRRPNSSVKSPPSDVLLLVVTGYSPKPSLRAHQGGTVTVGENVALQCQKPGHVAESHRFALLKKGTSTPIQLRSPVGRETDFSLQSVTVDDIGDYSCMYYQTRPPFWASEPSDHIKIWVTGSPSTDSPGTISRDSTMGNLIRLSLSAVIMVLMGAFLVEAWWSQKGSPCGSSSETPVIMEEEKKQVP